MSSDEQDLLLLPTTPPATLPQEVTELPAALAAPPGLASVVIPCFGQLEFTRFCVPSVLRHTRGPYELLFVDAGSLDGTSEYLAGIADAAPVPVQAVRVSADMPPPLACQEALARTEGEFVVLLRNDAVVPDAWLGQLTALAGLDPLIGMVGAMSNYAPADQYVGQLPYRLGAGSDWGAAAGPDPGEYRRQLDLVDRFARQWREQHRGQWFKPERLGGPCLLLKREALRAVLPLEGRSALNFFDPEALGLRAQRAGYHLACCRDLFIHHFGSRGSTPPGGLRRPS
jgi:GT2 family glycosyltransferase